MKSVQYNKSYPMLKEFQPLISSNLTRRFSAGSTILYQGEVPRSAMILTSGLVRVFSISEQGGEQIVMFHVPGEFFPVSWIYRRSTSTLFFYEAVKDSEIAFIPKNDILSYMTSTPEITEAVIQYFATHYSASLMRVNALEQPKARDKLVYTLYYLVQSYSVGNKNNGIVDLPISLTHQNLASLVGLTRETTATEMNKLKKQKILSYENQLYKIDIEKLLDIIGEDSFRGMEISL
jgi:CRP-like cAMP-binding protein